MCLFQLDYNMTPTALQVKFELPLNELRAWARSKNVQDVSLEGIWKHFIGESVCTCGTKTRWDYGSKSYREFCSTACQHKSADVVARRRATCLKRFGTEDANNSLEIKEKKRSVFLKRYGVDNPSKARSVKDKKRQTFLDNWGAEHWTKAASSVFDYKNPMTGDQAKASKDKIRNTCLQRYGVDNASKRDAFKSFMREENRRRANESPNDKYRRKKIVDRFGTEHWVQGYEPQAIEWLQKKNSVTRIVSASRKLPRIRYQLKGKQHFYYPDLAVFTSSHRHLIEVKSDLTITCGLEVLDAKFSAATKFMQKRGGKFGVLVVVNPTKTYLFENTSATQIVQELGLTPFKRK